jgi:hypothetical protein
MFLKFFLVFLHNFSRFFLFFINFRISIKKSTIFKIPILLNVSDFKKNQPIFLTLVHSRTGKLKAP